jgi:hypothetical protein
MDRKVDRSWREGREEEREEGRKGRKGERREGERGCGRRQHEGASAGVD